MSVPLAGGESGQGFFERGGVFYVEGFLVAIDLAHEAGEDFAWADFDEVSCALGDEELDALDPADGAGDLADEAVAGFVGVGEEARVDVAGYGVGWVVEVDCGEVGGEGVLCGLHKGAVEGCADLEHDGALGSGLLAEVGGALDCGGGAGDDGLVGGVEVGGRDDGAVGVEGFGLGGGGERGELVGDLGADLGDEWCSEAEDGGHGAFAWRDGLLHVLATGADGADGVGEGESAGDDVGGVFAEGVACGQGWGDALFGQYTGGCYGDGEDGGLGVLGELELVFGTFEDEFGEGKAEGVVGLFEDGAGGGEVVVEVAAHAYGLRALAGEEESWFSHR
jgi:hypothetical protein